MYFPEKIKLISTASRVLEVGPGSKPYPRADVFLERRYKSEQEYLEQCGMSAPNFDPDKTYYYDGGRFPFEDQAFDYVICSQVLEHVPADELDLFISELQRVAGCGYLEFPSAYYEVICFPEVHRWFLNYRDGEIILLDKSEAKSNYVHRGLREMWYAEDSNFVQAFKRHEAFFFIGFEWEETISYRVSTDWDDLVGKEEFESWRGYFRLFEPNTGSGASVYRSLRSRLATVLRCFGVHPRQLRAYATASPIAVARDYFRSKRRYADFALELAHFREQAGGDARFDSNALIERPMLNDKNPSMQFDHHYFFHPVWATRVLAAQRPAKHIDISSIMHFSATLAAFIPTEYYEFQAPELGLGDFPTHHVELTRLPFTDGAVESLSCMHVIEHVGLGRYGDAIDPQGDLLAARELQRVLSPGGLLLFVVPIAAEPRIEFNAHRVYTFEMVLAMFPELDLQEFALIPDPASGATARLIRNADPSECTSQHYACGCFHFSKRESPHNVS